MIIKTDEEIKELSDTFEKDAIDFANKLDNSNLLAEDYNNINCTLSSLLTGALIDTKYFEKITVLSNEILESSDLLKNLASKKTKQDIIDFFKDFDIRD